MTTNKYTSNNTPILVAASNADGETPVYLYADPTTHGLVVSATISAAGLATSTIQTDGTQKTQIVDAGGEVATVTGGKLDVNATASLAGVSVPISGATTAVGVAIVDGAGDQITSFGGGTQYADGAARGTATGTIAMGDDGTNIQSIHVDSSGDLQVDVLSMPTTAVTGTFWQATQPVSLASVPSHAVTNAGTFAVQNTEVQGSTGTSANVTMTGAAVTLQAANSARKNVMIFNDSGVVVYVKLGSSATASSYTVKLVDQAYYELPTPVYTGIITAFGASGTVRVTEVA